MTQPIKHYPYVIEMLDGTLFRWREGGNRNSGNVEIAMVAPSQRAGISGEFQTMTAADFPKSVKDAFKPRDFKVFLPLTAVKAVYPRPDWERLNGAGDD